MEKVIILTLSVSVVIHTETFNHLRKKIFISIPASKRHLSQWYVEIDYFVIIQLANITKSMTLFTQITFFIQDKEYNALFDEYKVEGLSIGEFMTVSFVELATKIAQPHYCI